MQGQAGNPLTPYASACGLRHLTANVPYTTTVLSVLSGKSLECLALSQGTNTPNSCLACPKLLPQVRITSTLTRKLEGIPNSQHKSTANLPGSARKESQIPNTNLPRICPLEI